MSIKGQNRRRDIEETMEESFGHADHPANFANEAMKEALDAAIARKALDRLTRR